jgi:hypothetical protein
MADMRNNEVCLIGVVSLDPCVVSLVPSHRRRPYVCLADAASPPALLGAQPRCIDPMSYGLGSM